MRQNAQAGFSLLGILIAVAIVGIMASVAIPRFVSTIAAANTAKVQSDLTTLDAAIAVYRLEKGHDPATVADLGDYINDIGKLKPPSGACKLIDGSEIELKDVSYEIKSVTEPGTAKASLRAVCDGHTAGDFGHGGKKTVPQTRQ